MNDKTGGGLIKTMAYGGRNGLFGLKRAKTGLNLKHPTLSPNCPFYYSKTGNRRGVSGIVRERYFYGD